MMIRTLCAALALLACCASARAETLALRGATLIDLSDFGRGTRDVEDATVLIEGERIVAVGAASEVAIPAHARVIDARGRFLVPGLVDLFTAQNDEAQARAHLHMGVTTVFYVDGDSRRGPTEWIPQGPNLKGIDFIVGYDQSTRPMWEAPGELRVHARGLEPDELRSVVDVQHWGGYAASLLYYGLQLEQTRVIAQRMRARRMLPIGEIGHSGTLASARAGVPLFVHANRYLIDLAPPELRAAVADDPFGPTRTRYMEFLQQLDPESGPVRDFARAFAREHAALMPTFAMLDLWREGHANPWKEPVGAILDPAQIMLPADRETGEPPPFGTRPLEQSRREVRALEALHRTLAREGAKFVVGSGADAFGTLPGLGVHLEMEALVRVGLTPRAALAAATTNLSNLLDYIDYGVIRAGARADLLLLEADPRVDVRQVRRISTLILRGAEVDRAALLTTPLQALAP